LKLFFNTLTENLAKIAKAFKINLQELFVFEHKIEDNPRALEKIDELLKDASKKEYKTIYRVIEAILK
jgi:hypothetical protein